MNELIGALRMLDVNNDDHWTSEGLPRLDVMKDFAGKPVSRADIASVVKSFTRTSPDLPGDEEFELAPEPLSLQEQKQLVSAKLDAANEALAKAAKVKEEAVAEMDKIIEQEPARNTPQTLSEDIKKFQQSQAMQREANAGRLKVVQEALLGTKTRF